MVWDGASKNCCRAVLSRAGNSASLVFAKNFVGVSLPLPLHRATNTAAASSPCLQKAVKKRCSSSTQWLAGSILIELDCSCISLSSSTNWASFNSGSALKSAWLCTQACQGLGLWDMWQRRQSVTSFKSNSWLFSCNPTWESIFKSELLSRIRLFMKP